MNTVVKARLLPIVVSALLLGVGGYFGFSSAKAQQSTGSPEEVVKTYLRNIDNKWGANRDLFVKSDAPIVGIPSSEGASKIWVRNSESVIREGEAPGGGAVIYVDKIRSTTNVSLSSVSVDYHTDVVRSRAVFVLTSESGMWKIASMVFETRPL